MNSKTRKLKSFLPIFLVIVFGLIAISPGAADGEEIKLYVTPEAEYLSIGDLLAHLLEAELEAKVDKKIQYSEVGLKKTANGEGDLFVGLKLPRSDNGMWAEYAYRLCDLGPVYEDVIGGWGVPSYVPEETLGSVTDFSDPEVRKRLQGEIVGDASEKSLLEKSKEVVKNTKGLEEYKLVTVDRIALISELGRVTRNDEWIAVTIARPSITFSTLDIRFVAELTEEQRVHVFGRKDLMEKYRNEITQFLSRFYLPVDLVNELILLYDKDKGSAAQEFIDKYPQLVSYWIEGPSSL